MRRCLAIGIGMWCVSAALVYAGPQEDFSAGVKAYQETSYNTAILIFKRFLREYPHHQNSAEASLYTAWAYYHTGNFTRALDTAHALIAGDVSESARAQAQYVLVSCLFKQELWPQCHAQAQEFIDRFKTDAAYFQVMYLLSVTNIRQGMYDKADEGFQRIIAGAPNDAGLVRNAWEGLLESAYYGHRWGHFASLMKEYTRIYPGAITNSRLNFYYAESMYARGEYEDALLHYTAALAGNTDPFFADVINQSLALALLETGKKQEALAAIGHITHQQSRQFTLGTYYYKNKEYTRALEIFDGLLKDFPQGLFFADVYVSQATIYYEMGRIHDAMFAYRYILSFNNPAYQQVYARARYGLALCYIKKNDYDRALTQLQKAVSDTEDSGLRARIKARIAEAYYRKGDLNRALDMYEDVGRDSLAGSDAEYALFQTGIVYIKQNRYADAARVLLKAARVYPNGAYAAQTWYHIALVRLELEDISGAEEALKRFFLCAPKRKMRDKGLYMRARCLHAAHKTRAAERLYRKILRFSIDAQSRELALAQLAYLAAAAGELEQAKQYWLELIRRYPRSEYVPRAYIFLGEELERGRDFDAAGKKYELVAERFPAARKDALFALMRVAVERGDFARAREYITKLEKIDYDTAVRAQLYTAAGFERSGQLEQALVMYEAASRASSPLRLEALYEKARILQEDGRYRQAIEVLRTLAAAGQDAGAVSFMLGMCLEKTGTSAEAIASYRDAAFSGDSQYRLKALLRLARLYEKEGAIPLAKKAYRDIIDMQTSEAEVAKEKLLELDRQ